MYFLDTNLLLEILLAQEVKEFLLRARRDQLFLSDFSLYSIGTQAVRRGVPEAFVKMVDDLILQGAVCIAQLPSSDMQRLVQVAQQFGLDFDDAYQYVLASQRNFHIVSFDADFDRTDRGRKTPLAILKGMTR